jgi:alkanesulfonate monooxygenase SsuD/methylene tetrahydromethanopterin reductase-like flavin-dependent oxidoreductase (luciferase family)
MPDLRIGVCYDFRNPPGSGLENRVLYGEILEQVQWLDRIGADLVWFTEHHFVDDGYLPSWVPVAGAMASRTSRVRFGTDICLMPFNHPVRLAEDLAVLDNITGGRVELGVGMGYAPHEFRGFGVPVGRRVSLMDEGIEVLQRCFAGGTFSYRGRRYQLEDVTIRPGYVQEGGPPLFVAAMSKAGALRAARHDTHFLPQGSKAEVYDTWTRALADSGRDRSRYRVGIIRTVHVAERESEAAARVLAAERYRMVLYQKFFAESGQPVAGADEAVPQRLIIGGVEHCVAALKDFVTAFGITDLVTMAVPPGLRPAQMADSLEALFTRVVPRVKAELGG